MAGANLIFGMGMMELGATLSFSQMVMDDEIAGMIKRQVRGIDVTKELMAVDLIKKVGISGNFLGQKHTMKHLLSEQSQAGVTDRRMRGGWEKRGAKDLHQASIDKAKAILANHKPKPLEDSLKKELLKIAKSLD